jgi:hypothetical protein
LLGLRGGAHATVINGDVGHRPSVWCRTRGR